MSDTANPYSSPVETADSFAATGSPLEYKKTTFGNALFRWTLICIVSAAPSFFFGMALTEGRPASIVAMLLGVAVYSFGYAIVDIQPFWRRSMSTPFLRPAIISGFTIRCVISFLFPIAMFNDMMCGALSMNIGNLGQMMEQAPVGRTPGLGTVATFVITMIQGLVLNLEIAAVIFLLYGILLGVDKFKRRRNVNSGQETLDVS